MKPKASYTGKVTTNPRYVRIAKLNGLHHYLSMYLSKNHDRIFGAAPEDKQYVVAIMSTTMAEKGRQRHEPILRFFTEKKEVFEELRKNPGAAFDHKDTPRLELMY